MFCVSWLWVASRWSGSLLRTSNLVILSADVFMELLTMASISFRAIASSSIGDVVDVVVECLSSTLHVVALLAHQASHRRPEVRLVGLCWRRLRWSGPGRRVDLGHLFLGNVSQSSLSEPTE